MYFSILILLKILVSILKIHLFSFCFSFALKSSTVWKRVNLGLRVLPLLLTTRRSVRYISTCRPFSAKAAKSTLAVTSTTTATPQRQIRRQRPWAKWPSPVHLLNWKQRVRQWRLPVEKKTILLVHFLFFKNTHTPKTIVYWADLSITFAKWISLQKKPLIGSTKCFNHISGANTFVLGYLKSSTISKSLSLCLKPFNSIYGFREGLIFQHLGG